MARIRSVKPEFWTSEQVAECSPNARLLFIGMWNFCDDYGVHPASEMRLKMEVFPSDDITKDDIRRMIGELQANNLIQEYEIDGSRYWWVTGWDKHQKPDTKTGRYPKPDGSIGGKIRRMNTEYSPNGSGAVGDHSPPELELELEKEIFIPAEAGKEKSQGKTSGPPKRAVQLPKDFVPDATCVELAVSLGRSASAELPAFADFHRSKGSTFKDWQSAFRTWLRNSVKFGPPASATASTHAFDPCRGAI